MTYVHISNTRCHFSCNGDSGYNDQRFTCFDIKSIHIDVKDTIMTILSMILFDGLQMMLVQTMHHAQTSLNKTFVSKMLIRGSGL